MHLSDISVAQLVHVHRLVQGSVLCRTHCISIMEMRTGTGTHVEVHVQKTPLVLLHELARRLAPLVRAPAAAREAKPAGFLCWCTELSSGRTLERGHGERTDL